METVLRKKWVSYLYRTATTVYPCYVPILGIQQELVVQDLPGGKVNKQIIKSKALFSKNKKSPRKFGGFLLFKSLFYSSTLMLFKTFAVIYKYVSLGSVLATKVTFFLT